MHAAAVTFQGKTTNYAGGEAGMEVLCHEILFANNMIHNLVVSCQIAGQLNMTKQYKCALTTRKKLNSDRVEDRCCCGKV